MDSPLGFFNKVPIKANFSLLSGEEEDFLREKKATLEKTKKTKEKPTAEPTFEKRVFFPLF